MLRSSKLGLAGLLVLSACGLSEKNAEVPSQSDAGGDGSSGMGSLESGGSDGSASGGRIATGHSSGDASGTGGRASGDPSDAGVAGSRAAVGGGAGQPGEVEIPTCVPGRSVACACSDGRTGAQVCLEDGSYDACACIGGSDFDAAEKLGWYVEGMVGTWHGSRETIWDGVVEVSLEFFDDGHYSASCIGDGCSTFYWGIEGDSPLRVWALTDVRADQHGEGTLALLHNSGSTRGELDNVWMSEDQNELFFDLYPQGRDVVGPAVFELLRAQ